MKTLYPKAEQNGNKGKQVYKVWKKE